MTSTNKLKYKIKKGYENRSGKVRHDNSIVALGKTEEYTKTEKFLKLKDEYLKADDEFVKSING